MSESVDPSSSFKQRVAFLLDERNARNSKPAKLVTVLIVALILISAFQVVLESHPGTSEVGHWLEAINLTCTLVFTLELGLRIWTANLLDPEFSGLRGRIRFLLTPYSIIDVVAILPAAVSLAVPGSSWATLKVLRILRLLKLARFLKSFNFIIAATRKKKSELSISMQILLLLTFILSVLLHKVENAAQPDDFSSIWHAMLWSMSQYIGDIGGYADFSPVTTAGKLLATCVGILSIAIFAVPSGIIASGFVEEMEEEKTDAEVRQNANLIISSFAPTKVKALGGTPVPARRRTLPFLQSKLELTPEEIMSAVRASDELRLKFEKSSPELKVYDMTVVECFEKNRPYGFEIEAEDATVHIINPQGRAERGISHFAVSLGKTGGHHVVSNELFAGSEVLPEQKCNVTLNPLFALDDGLGFEDADAFVTDSMGGLSAKDEWVVVLRSSAAHHPAQFHVVFGGIKGTAAIEAVESPTFNPQSKGQLERFIERLTSEMAELGHATHTHETFASTSPNLLHQHIHRKSGANVLSLFVSVELLSAPKKDYYAVLAGLVPALEELKA